MGPPVCWLFLGTYIYLSTQITSQGGRTSTHSDADHRLRQPHRHEDNCHYDGPSGHGQHSHQRRGGQGLAPRSRPCTSQRVRQSTAADTPDKRPQEQQQAQGVYVLWPSDYSYRPPIWKIPPTALPNPKRDVTATMTTTDTTFKVVATSTAPNISNTLFSPSAKIPRPTTLSAPATTTPHRKGLKP